jgi:hypothetical protein
MATELTLTEIAARLELLEDKVRELGTQLNPRESATQSDFEYIISVDDQEVWSGQDLYTNLLEIHQRYPVEQITIGWRSPSLIWV